MDQPSHSKMISGGGHIGLLGMLGAALAASSTPMATVHNTFDFGMSLGTGSIGRRKRKAYGRNTLRGYYARYNSPAMSGTPTSRKRERKAIAAQLKGQRQLETQSMQRVRRQPRPKVASGKGKIYLGGSLVGTGTLAFGRLGQ